MFFFNTGSITPNVGDYTDIVNSLVTYTVGSALNSRQNIMDIPINDDAIVEGTESFTVTLSAVAGPGNPQVNALLSVATVFIIDNDGEYNKEIKNKGEKFHLQKSFECTNQNSAHNQCVANCCNC